MLVKICNFPLAVSFPLWQYPVVVMEKLKRERRKLLPELRAWMKRTGTTQEALARMLGLSAPQICRVFQGKRHFALDVAARLALIADIPVEKLLTGGEAAQLLKLLGKQSRTATKKTEQNANVA